MAEDGLGETMTIDAPERYRLEIYRSEHTGTGWGHNEPRGDVMGPWRWNGTCAGVR
jgi:hypothetical protein